MATITGSTNVERWTHKLVTTEGSYDIAKNTSILSVDIYIGRKSGSGSSYITGANISGTVSCTGCTAKSFSYRNTGTVNIADGGWLKIATVKFDAVPHDTDGSKTVTVSSSFTQANINPTRGSASGSVTLTKIPRSAKITSVPDFDDETESFVIEYSNPAGNSVTKLEACVSLTGARDDVPYREITNKTGTSFVFTLSDADRTMLRKNTLSGSNSRTVKVFLRTLFGTAGYSHIVDKTFTVINANPIVQPFLKDTGDNSKRLVGDSGNIIKGYNVISVATRAQGVKEASITEQSITCGNKSISVDSGILTDVESGTFVFRVKDNRNNVTTETVTRTLVDYIKLTCNLHPVAPTTEGVLTFNITGDYFDGSFGAVNNNLKVEYRYKAQGEGYPVDEDGKDLWMSADTTISDGKYRSVVEIIGLDYTKSYTLQARAADEVHYGYILTREYVVKTMPVFDWGENDFNFNVPVHSKGGITYDTPICHGDVDTMLISGTYYMGSLAANKPGQGGNNGWLKVIGVTEQTCYQKYIAFTGEEYERWRVDGVWGTWLFIDHIVEKGENGIWTYEKWMSGKAECWGTTDVYTVQTLNAWGNVFSADHVIPAIAFPFAFVEIPKVSQYTLYGGQSNYWTFSATNATTTHAPTVSVIRPTNAPVQAQVDFHVIGRWK